MYSPSRLSSAVDGQLLAKRRRAAYGGTVGPGEFPWACGCSCGTRSSSPASARPTRTSSRAPLLMEFVAAPHERGAELAKHLHDTEHAGDNTTSVGEPDEGGGQNEFASIDDGVLIVSSRKAAPMLEAVEGTFDDVAAAVGVLVVADRAAAAGAAATAMGFLVMGFGGQLPIPRLAGGRGSRARSKPCRPEHCRPPERSPTRRPASSGSIIGASPAWPGVSRMTSGRPRPSTAAWILLLSPPRDLPRRDRPVRPCSSAISCHSTEPLCALRAAHDPPQQHVWRWPSADAPARSRNRPTPTNRPGQQRRPWTGSLAAACPRSHR